MKQLSTLDQGFDLIPNVIPGAQLDELAIHLDHIDSVGSRCLLDHEWCQSLATQLRVRISGAVPECMSLKFVQATYFNKNDESNWFVSYHQDRSIPVSDDTPDSFRGWSRKDGRTFIQAPDSAMQQMLALRLHIDDSREDNGPLRVIPGSHQQGTLSQSEIDVLRNGKTEIELTAKRGDVIVMRPMLLHASSKSRTSNSRRVIHFLCGPADVSHDLKWRMTV